MSSELLERPSVVDAHASHEKPALQTPNLENIPVSTHSGGVSYQVQNPSESSPSQVLVALSPEENAKRWKRARETHKVSCDFHPHH